MSGFDESRYADIKTLDMEVAHTTVTVPPVEGQSYEDTVPDTLDLADRAELAIQGITSMLDPTRDYYMYSEARFSRIPAVIRFTGNGSIVCAGKHLESLPLLRSMTGSTFNRDIDSRFMESMLHMTGKDGSIYIPTSTAANYPAPIPEPLASTRGEGRHILALSMWYQRDKNPLWRDLVERKIERLSGLATEEEDYAYFNREPYLESDNGPLSDTLPGLEAPLEIVGDASDGFKTVVEPKKKQKAKVYYDEHLWDIHSDNFMLTRSLCVYYRLTGHEPALELAGKLVRGVLKRWKGFEDDGRFLLFHFHTGTASLLAILEYAMITKGSDLIEFVTRGYEFAVAVSGSLVGFFPEITPGFEIRKVHHPNKTYADCETCEVADMIGLALKLTSAGAGDHWEEVDRWTRNQFVENQLTQDKLEALLDKEQAAELFDEKPVEAWESEEVERAIGTFAGHAMPDDFGVFVANACCTGNAARNLYWVWDSILTRENDEVRVNLLLNRASPWLDVHSYLPNRGKVVLKIKQAEAVSVRIPEWTDHDKVTCQVNGAERSFSRSGSYIRVGALSADDTVTVEFPMVEKTLFELIGDIPYKVTMRGNTVVDMESTVMGTEAEVSFTGEPHMRDPGGYPDALRKKPFAPLYQRDEYKTAEPAMKKATRFAPTEVMTW
jgi:hypothetical protein